MYISLFIIIQVSYIVFEIRKGSSKYIFIVHRYKPHSPFVQEKRTAADTNIYKICT